MRREEREVRADESDDEPYNEGEDDDFNPEQQDADASASSSEDEDGETKVQVNKKRKTGDVAELDSGDEATIRERKSKKRRKQDDADSEGEGSMVRTRAQRLVEKVERKQKKKIEGGRVTIDVDAVWADLASQPVGQPSALLATRPVTNDDETIHNGETSKPEMIKIRRRIKFAGQITEVEEEVSADSAEAQAYLDEQEQAQQVKDQATDDEKLNRPLRRISLFEPNPLGVVKGVPAEKLRRKAPTRNDMLMAAHREEEERKKKAEKLTTMQKTALDWKGFVVEQGLGDELKEYGKSKKGYLAREQFLDRVHGANEIARRTARLKT